MSRAVEILNRAQEWTSCWCSQTERRSVWAKGFQAIKFVMVDFDESWDRTMLVTGYANIRYTATKKGSKLAVVFEGATGTMSTYRYQLAPGEEVFVVDQVIHIPGRCQKQEPDNAIKCG